MSFNNMNLQTSLVAANFGDSKQIKTRMQLDRGYAQTVRISLIEEAAVFHAADSMPFGDTEALFDDVDWELGRLIAGSYGRGL